ncbi:ABC transporter ATP-binding protein [Campylobacter lari]|uniref:ABC transporter ATP-binding protein n=1 Tax=Campylobacter lari TaxID=201 RepID=UPI00214A0BA7|nr:ABC transporter ATP-binding protein [Campylobacter lari]MCR2068042.1 ABC transporter ATP-binding protein [Campylobacter lari subsp. concheus]
MIKIHNLYFSYDHKTLLENININLKHQTFLGILGPNGSGKSTLLKLLLKDLMPNQGEIILLGENMNHINTKDISRLIGLVPQKYKLQAPLKVVDVLLMGRYNALKHSFSSYTHEDIKEVKNYAKTLQCEHLLHRNILSLSGGEFQKILIIRALLKNPKILFLDEPTSALDLKHSIEILKFCEQLIHEKNISIVAILHDLNLASIFCDQLVFLKDGKVRYFDSTHKLFTPEILYEIYGLKCEVIHKNARPYVLALKE